MKKLFALLMAAMMLLCCVACGGGNDTPNPPTDTTASITIGTGSTSGTYYAYTNAVGMILKDATGYTYNVISTGGSVANINGIEDGDYNMAIVQNDTMIKAYNKLDDFNFPVAITSFSVLGEVYSEVMQVVVRSDLKDTVKTLADVKGLRVSIGDAGSGTEANAKALLAAYGVSTDDITVQNLSVNNSADAMKDGKLDVFFFTSGAPTTAITELQTAMDIYLLGLDDAVMDEFIANNKVGDYAVYAKMAVTHDQYACIPADAPITTIGVTATYIVSNSLSEDQVYNMTKALWESKDEIANALKGSQMVFITAGMGGGTGTGAAPVVARVAHEMEVLTIGIVTKPFAFEGKQRMDKAEKGIKELRQYVDALVVIPNEKLKEASSTKITLSNAWNIADNYAVNHLQGDELNYFYNVTD